MINNPEIFRHRFIVIEGIDGSGKSTVVQSLADQLNMSGISTVTTKDPGSTDIGNKIRDILLNEDHHMSKWSRTFMHMASRANLIDEVIYPALADGKTVICDRFVPSTMAYQWAPGIKANDRRFNRAMDKIMAVHFTTVRLWPDHTVILDVDEETSKARRASRGVPNDTSENFLDSRFKRIRQAYLSYAEAFSQTVTLVDGRMDQHMIMQSVIDSCRSKLEGRSVKAWITECEHQRNLLDQNPVV